MKMTATSRALEAQDQLADLALLRHAERRGRLVHDQELGVPVDGAADGDGLALAAREVADRLAQLAAVDVDVERVQDGRRGLAHGAAVDARQEAERAAHRLAAEEDVGADVEIVGERQVLVDGLDAAARGPRGGWRRPTRSPLYQISPSSGWKTPEIALIRVDLPAPLSPASATTSPRTQLEADLLERVDAAEALGDLVAAQDGLGHQPSSAGRPGRRRWDWSISTETMMTMPTATNCQNGSTLMKTSPYWMTAMMRAPIDRADDRARAAEQRGAADHDGGDRSRAAAARRPGRRRPRSGRCRPCRRRRRRRREII